MTDEVGTTALILQPDDCQMCKRTFVDIGDDETAKIVLPLIVCEAHYAVMKHALQQSGIPTAEIDLEVDVN